MGHHTLQWIKPPTPSRSLLPPPALPHSPQLPSPLAFPASLLPAPPSQAERRSGRAGRGRAPCIGALSHAPAVPAAAAPSRPPSPRGGLKRCRGPGRSRHATAAAAAARPSAATRMLRTAAALRPPRAPSATEVPRMGPARAARRRPSQPRARTAPAASLKLGLKPCAEAHLAGQPCGREPSRPGPAAGPRPGRPCLSAPRPVART
jgi:hypothetical protein